MSEKKELAPVEKKAEPVKEAAPKPRGNAAVNSFTLAMVALGLMVLGGFVLVPFALSIASLVMVGAAKKEDRNMQKGFSIVALPVAIVVLVITAITIITAIISIIITLLVVLFLTVIPTVIYILVMVVMLIVSLIVNAISSGMYAMSALLIL